LIDFFPPAVREVEPMIALILPVLIVLGLTGLWLPGC
jgi:hypothetical protein